MSCRIMVWEDPRCIRRSSPSPQTAQAYTLPLLLYNGAAAGLVRPVIVEATPPDRGTLFEREEATGPVLTGQSAADAHKRAGGFVSAVDQLQMAQPGHTSSLPRLSPVFQCAVGKGGGQKGTAEQRCSQGSWGLHACPFRTIIPLVCDAPCPLTSRRNAHAGPANGVTE